MGINRFDKLFEEANASFNGIYNNELHDLHGISTEEIKTISEDQDAMPTYSVLIKLVEKASQDNLSQAELGEHIKELGSLAVKIAKKVPGLANFVD